MSSITVNALTSIKFNSQKMKIAPRTVEEDNNAPQALSLEEIKENIKNLAARFTGLKIPFKYCLIFISFNGSNKRS